MNYQILIRLAIVFFLALAAGGCDSNEQPDKNPTENNGKKNTLNPSTSLGESAEKSGKIRVTSYFIPG